MVFPALWVSGARNRLEDGLFKILIVVTFMRGSENLVCEIGQFGLKLNIRVRIIEPLRLWGVLHPGSLETCCSQVRYSLK